ncbi:MAG: hypothetical protein OQK12_04070 [Motiliproteus sp.]|nr:hypothetical protein [Motiliproteus sp.]MCW9053309.1 hypothetical protein [Motiliproteus sp.]
METNKPKPSPDPKGESSSVQESKRQLLGAILATPIIASIPSRSAWGSNCSISGMLSGNLSRQPDTYECRSANGKSPGFWKTHPGCWPVQFGTIQKKINGSWVTVNPCDPNIINPPNGKISGSLTNYKFIGGATLQGLLDGLGAVGLGFNNTVMEYLQGNVSYPKHLAAALLSSFHNNANYPYSPQELADAAVSARNLGKEGQLDSILMALQDGPDASEADDLSLVINMCP